MHIRFTAMLGVFAAALTLSALPSHAQAPAAPAAPTVCTTNSPKAFVIAPSYVLASEASYKKAVRHLAPSPNHDALLMAALLKDGAHLTGGPRITTNDGVSATMDTSSSFGSSHLQMKPCGNADGSVTVPLKIQAEAAMLGLPLPSSTTLKLETKPTFQDKQTLLVGSTKATGYGIKDASTLLVFVRVSTPDVH